MDYEPQPQLTNERLVFLATLPTVINSSLETKRIIDIAIKHLKERLEAEAASVFLLNESGSELTFWAMSGGADSELVGKKMPADQGIVGWCIQKQESHSVIVFFGVDRVAMSHEGFLVALRSTPTLTICGRLRV